MKPSANRPVVPLVAFTSALLSCASRTTWLASPRDGRLLSRRSAAPRSDVGGSANDSSRGHWDDDLEEPQNQGDANIFWKFYGQIDKLRKALLQLVEENNQLKDKVKNLLKTVGKCKEESSQLKIQVEDLHNTVHELKEENGQLRSQVADWQESANTVQRDNDRLREKSTALEDVVSQLQESPRQRQERVASQWEMDDVKNPLVSTVSGSPTADRNRHYKHLPWWFPAERPWTHRGEYGWHEHARTEVLYCIAGELRIEANGKINVALPGEKVVVPAGTQHRIPPESPWVQVAIAGGAA